MKKIIISAGTLVAAISPIGVAVSCETQSKVSKPFNYSFARDRVSTDATNIGEMYLSFRDHNGYQTHHQPIGSYYAESGTMAPIKAREALAKYLNTLTLMLDEMGYLNFPGGDRTTHISLTAAYGTELEFTYNGVENSSRSWTNQVHEGEPLPWFEFTAI